MPCIRVQTVHHVPRTGKEDAFIAVSLLHVFPRLLKPLSVVTNTIIVIQQPTVLPRQLVVSLLVALGAGIIVLGSPSARKERYMFNGSACLSCGNEMTTLWQFALQRGEVVSSHAIHMMASWSFISSNFRIMQH